MRDSPVNPPADYAEVQDTAGVRNAQSSSFDESEAGQKLVPRPEDVTGFESAFEPDAPVHGTNQKGAESVGRSVDYDARDKAKREREVSNGQVDQRRGY
ncbi:hypothetical protein BC629DRAFT_1592637 [Irpex lacteus]|nr:hypothetical protein BC629DRAFT_1592637 [Irpex lacteus]